MIFIPYFLFIFKLTLQLIIKIFVIEALLLKFWIIIILSFFAYTLYLYPTKRKLKLSFIRKKKYNFLDKYRLDNMIQFLYACFISLVYFGIFVGGFLYLRFLNSHKILSLKPIFINIYNLILPLSYIHILCNIIIIVLILIIYKIVFTYILQYCRICRQQLYIIFYSRENLLFETHKFLNKFSSSHFFSDLCNNLSIIFYILGLKKSYTIYDSKKPTWERILFRLIRTKETKLHYYFLGGALIYDIFLNSLTLQMTYKLMPYIFLYDLWVRFSKTLFFKNMLYDEFVYYYIYGTIYENNDHFLIIGDREWSKEFVKDAFHKYIYNNFLDKEMMQHKEEQEKRKISEIYDYKKYLKSRYKKYKRYLSRRIRHQIKNKDK